MSVSAATPTVHECVFVEEQEPGGRLILPPCIVCGLPAMDALNQLRAEGNSCVAGSGHNR